MARLAFAFGACALLLVACGDDDTGTDGTPDMGSPDAGPQWLDMGAPRLFGACESDTDCQSVLGPAAFCRTAADGWSGGQCTLPCVDRGPCGELQGDVFFYHHCVDLWDRGETICEEACDNSFDCRPNYICVGKGAIPGRDEGICVGICQDDLDCGPSAECNVYAGSCVAPGTVPTVGAKTGEACADDDACLSGNCITATGSSGPTGWNGGTCIGVCQLPLGYNSNTFYAGETLPTDGCPDDAVCFPIFGELVERSQGGCLQSCEADADCRGSEGYECRKTWQIGGTPSTYTNGVCWPIDCSVKECPAGYSCRSTTNGGSICAPA